MGVYIHPYVAVLGGYKKIRQDVFFTTVNSGGSSNPTFRDRSELSIEGPTIGIAGSVPISNGFGIYANYAHGFMNAEIRDVALSPTFSDPGKVDLDAAYDVAEAGFTYTHGLDSLPADVPLSAATVYAGYRWQNFETQTLSGSERSDTTRGFAVGVNLAF